MVDQIRKQEHSKVRKRHNSSKQTLKPPPSKFAKVVSKQRHYLKGQNRLELEISISEWNGETGRALDKNKEGRSLNQFFLVLVFHTTPCTSMWASSYSTDRRLELVLEVNV